MADIGPALSGLFQGAGRGFTQGANLRFAVEGRERQAERDATLDAFRQQQIDAQKKSAENQSQQNRVTNLLALTKLVDSGNSEAVKALLPMFATSMGMDPKGLLVKTFGDFATAKDRENRELALSLIGLITENPEQVAQLEKLVETNPEQAMAIIVKAASSGLEGQTLTAFQEQSLGLRGEAVDISRQRLEQAGDVTKTRQERINDRMDRGFTRAEAEDLADNLVRLEKDPKTEELVLVNLATGVVSPTRGTAPDVVEGAEVAGPPAAPGPPTAPAAIVPAKTKKELLTQNVTLRRVLASMVGIEEAARKGTGGVSNLKAFFESTIGQIITATGGEKVTFDETMDAREALRLFNQEAKAALVNNPKFPVAEQQIVLDALVDPDTFFANPQQGAQDILQLRAFIEAKIKGNLEEVEGAGRTSTFAQPAAAPEGGSDTEIDAWFDGLPVGSLFTDPDTGLTMRKTK